MMNELRRRCHRFSGCTSGCVPLLPILTVEEERELAERYRRHEDLERPVAGACSSLRSWWGGAGLNVYACPSAHPGGTLGSHEGRQALRSRLGVRWCPWRPLDRADIQSSFTQLRIVTPTPRRIATVLHLRSAKKRPAGSPARRSGVAQDLVSARAPSPRWNSLNSTILPSNPRTTKAAPRLPPSTWWTCVRARAGAAADDRR